MGIAGTPLMKGLAERSNFGGKISTDCYQNMKIYSSWKDLVYVRPARKSFSSHKIFELRH